MELKDVILSTLAEIEELATTAQPTEKSQIIHEENHPVHEETITKTQPIEMPSVPFKTSVRDDEARMLEGIRERLLVLFEGFQSPNNVQIEAKVDLTLNFLEYLLATIDNRLDTIK
ncbi:MAG: hypothetical protein PHW64_06395 [Sulfuricurvum sp.]|nr:hypothetical protein [Sulfuricurvum sp.]